MEIKNVRWVGIGTDAYDDTVRLFGTVFGLPRAFQQPATVEFRTSQGDAVQVMGPGDAYHAFFRQHARGPVPLFEVDDLGEARRRLTANGFEIVGGSGRDQQWEWLHFLGPDDNLYELGARRRV